MRINDGSTGRFKLGEPFRFVLVTGLYLLSKSKKYIILFFALLVYCPIFLVCMSLLFIKIGQWFGLITLELLEHVKLHHIYSRIYSQLKCSLTLIG